MIRQGATPVLQTTALSIGNRLTDLREREVNLLKLRLTTYLVINHVLKQESRAAARKPRDAASVLFC